MRILLVKTRSGLRRVRALEGFICLEPLELEIVAGAAGPGDSVRILDLRLQKDPRQSFLELLRAYRPDMIGFTGYSIHVEAIKDLAGLAKEHCPEALTMVGGIHASLLPHDFIVPEIDLIDPYLYSDCFHTLIEPRITIKRFYRRYGRLTALALRYNPLRINRVRMPAGDFARAFVRGIRYIIAHHTLHRDYPA